jgi:hypothetical protein
MVGIIVMAMELTSVNVILEHAQSMEDGVIMVNGVNAPNLVVVEVNRDVDLVLVLDRQMVVKIVMVKRLMKDSVMPM